MANGVKVTITYQAPGKFNFAIGFHVASTVVDPTASPIPAIITAINAITAGKPLRVEISIVKNVTASPSSTEPYVCEDKAFGRFIDGGGNPHSYKIPAPLVSILATDTERIPDTGIWDDYVQAVLTNAKTSSNGALSTYVTAYRKENRKKLKR
jgi:hypothetical protein